MKTKRFQERESRCNSNRENCRRAVVTGVFRIYFHTLRGTLRERVSGENEISLETLSLLRKRFCPCYANTEESQPAGRISLSSKIVSKLKFSSAKKLFEKKRRLLSFV